MTDLNPDGIPWRKSSWSVGDGHCIEIAIMDSTVLIRDSKDRKGPILTLSVAAWHSLVQAIKLELLPCSAN